MSDPMQQLIAAQGSADRFAEADAIRSAARRLSPQVRRNGSGGLTVLDLFLEKVAFGASDCWYWRGALAGGYGACRLGGEVKAHRLAYRLFHGEIPAGMDVLHSCDVPSCVNPDHLSVGTHTDNMRDMAAKGRGRSPALSGEANPLSKLTAAQVEELRAAYAAGGVSMKSLAARYGVSVMTICRAINRKTWRTQ